MHFSRPATWDDTVLPFQLDAADIRGRLARLDGALRQILDQHAYPPQIEALMAEAVLLTALIGQAVKIRWKLSLQVRGNGPVRLIATDYLAPQTPGAPAQVRAWASFDGAALAAGPGFAQLGEGYFAVRLDRGDGKEPWQGITALSGDSLAASAEAYFSQSEQLPTRFALAFGKSRLPGGREGWRAGGLMVQHMPKASAARSDPGARGETPATRGAAIDDDAENWNRISLHTGTLEPLELIGPTVTPPELLLRLFHEEGPRIFTPQPVAFGCSCSPERVRASLSIYPPDEIAAMTTETGIVTADCQFCGAHYELDPADLGARAEGPDAEGPDPGGSGADTPGGSGMHTDGARDGDGRAGQRAPR